MNKSSTSNQPKKINKTLIFYDSARNKMSRHLQTKNLRKILSAFDSYSTIRSQYEKGKTSVNMGKKSLRGITIHIPTPRFLFKHPLSYTKAIEFLGKKGL